MPTWTLTRLAVSAWNWSIVISDDKGTRNQAGPAASIKMGKHTLVALASTFRHTAAILPLLVAFSLAGCELEPRSHCDMTPEGSVWLTVARLTWAEGKFHKLHGRYGSLAEMTDLEPGLPADVTAGRMGSYTLAIRLTAAGYILSANPDMAPIRSGLASFYADHTGLITFDRTGIPATPGSTRM